MRTCSIVILVFVIVVVLLIVVGVVLMSKKARQSKTVQTSLNSDVANAIRNTLDTVIKFVSSTNFPVPDVFTECVNSTVNRLRFCGGIKYSGSIDIGGVAVCDLPRFSCRSACSLPCTACHLIPFISCKTPCTTCPQACDEIYNECAGALKAKWTVNVVEVFDIANTMSLQDLDFETFTLQKVENSYVISARIPIKVSPSIKVDVSTTGGIGNYQGAVKLGNLKIVVPIEFAFDCETKKTTLKELKKLEVSGINLSLDTMSITAKLKELVFKLVKSNIENTIRDVLQDKLTDIFRTFIQSEFIPRFPVLDIPC